MKLFYKSFLLSVLISPFFVFNSFSQQAPGIEWQNTIGGDDADYLFSMQQITDKGYILGGTSGSSISGDKTENSLGATDYWVLKLDSAGNLDWQNTIGGSDFEGLYSTKQSSNTGYILGGYSRSNISGDKTENSLGMDDYWVIKLNLSGNIEWQNTIGGNDIEGVNAIDCTSDGEYIVGGTSRSNISGDKTENCLENEDFWILKLDSSGNIQWQNTMGGNDYDFLSSIQQTFDGGYILGGSSVSNISGDKTENSLGGFDYWLVKIDSNGNIQWQNTIGGNSEDNLFSVRQTVDGGYILGGFSNSNISGDKTENSLGGYDYWVVKLNPSGNIQWQNTIGGDSDEYLMAIKQTSDLGYIAAGTSLSNISGDKTENSIGGSDYWVIKMNNAGVIQWQNTIGGNNNEDLHLVSQTFDNGYVLGGTSTSNISGDKTENTIGLTGAPDYWIVKLFPDTITGISPTPTLLEGEGVAIAPNPSHGIFQLFFASSNQKTNYTIEILNTFVQKVFKSQILNPKSQINLDFSFLPKGIYLLKISDGENAMSEKLIIE